MTRGEGKLAIFNWLRPTVLTTSFGFMLPDGLNSLLWVLHFIVTTALHPRQRGECYLRDVRFIKSDSVSAVTTKSNTHTHTAR